MRLFGREYDGPNGSLFISIVLHNSEFWIPNSEIRIPQFALRILEFGIVKNMKCGQVVTAYLL